MSDPIDFDALYESLSPEDKKTFAILGIKLSSCILGRACRFLRDNISASSLQQSEVTGNE